VFAWTETTGGTSSRFWKIWPNPASAAAAAPIDIAGNAYGPMVAIGHQGRSVIQSIIAIAHGPNTAVGTSEDVYMTNGNLPTLYVDDTGQSVHQYGLENWSDVAAIVSSSHSELLMLKRTGGGYLIRGDLTFPTVHGSGGSPRSQRSMSRPSGVGVVFISPAEGVALERGESAGSPDLE
jgi:hypothetical protein